MNDYYINLNQVIEEIENNLTNKIDYKKLAKIIGTSDYTLQRIFCFLTGITLTEYIRKRRLTSAAEDLQKGNEKIIDIAIKYQYNSPISFSRAFTKMHGVYPSKVKDKRISLKLFPKIQFTPMENIVDEIEYRIEELDEQIFFGKHTKIHEDNKRQIAELYNKYREDGTLDYIIKNAKDEKLYYGATMHIFADNEEIQKDVFDYYILGKEKREDFTKIVIPKSTWAIFKVKSKEQKDILEVINSIYGKWLPSSQFNNIEPIPDIEIYYKDYCEYCIPVK